MSQKKTRTDISKNTECGEDVLFQIFGIFNRRLGGEYLRFFYEGADNVCRRIDELDAIPAHSVILGGEELSGEELFDRQQHDCLWECSGWEHVRDFIECIPPLEDDGEYTFAFELREDKYREDVSFPMLMLGAMLLRKGENKLMLGCSVEKSSDGVNRFALLKKR